jgi:hypothetical protein
MTETTMNLRALVEKAPDADALREMIGFGDQLRSAVNGLRQTATESSPTRW